MMMVMMVMIYYDYDDDGGDDNPFGDQNWFTQNIYSAVQKR